MLRSPVSTVYFATICLPPPALLLLYPLIFLYRLPVPAALLTGYATYFWVGFVLVFVHLWRLSVATDTKLVWTALLLFLGLFTLPIYWFKHVLPRPQKT